MPEKIAPRQMRLLPNSDGYMLGDQQVGGFADREDLPEGQRLRLARWARMLTPDQISPTQQLLLERATQHGRPQGWLEAMDDRDTLATGPVRAIWRALSEEQRAAVMHPDQRGLSYPLGVSQLAAMVGASERQIGYWAQNNLLPHFRDPHAPRDAYRFYSAAAVIAFGLAGTDKPEKAVLAKIARGEAAGVLALVAAIFEMRAKGLVHSHPASEAEISALQDLDAAAGEYLTEASRFS